MVPWISSKSSTAGDFWQASVSGYPIGTAPKKTLCGSCGTSSFSFYDQKERPVRDLPCGEKQIDLAVQIRRVQCRPCGKVKQEKLPWLADNTFYTRRFAMAVGRKCRSMTLSDVAQEMRLDWKTVKAMEVWYMKQQLEGAKAI
ncbi:MAG: helix-turn-helix domain-containing protein [Nitrospirota bacterium]